MPDRLTNEQLQNLVGYLPRCKYGGYYINGVVKCGLPNDTIFEILMIIYRFYLKTHIIANNQNDVYLDLEALRELVNPSIRPVPLYTVNPNPEIDAGIIDNNGNLLELPKNLPSRKLKKIKEKLPSYSREAPNSEEESSSSSSSNTRTVRFGSVTIVEPAPTLNISRLPRHPPIYTPS
ncbi:hypothetical protein DAPK24_016300 [Pichia kluyveri]|uniref:Uncharacterized protein n=1 Tax=Pichia kluyveri TaxID=36015 RepID=A0AAV5R0V9_PICKL|nr:hypothetical protein DAPK24_016300 [Pichia kluyveri]